MIDVRPFASLGHANHGWLDARHHFSFGSYRDAARSGWGRLVVWNDDEIAPGKGFNPHPHKDMEIITYVREGAITHRDSMGNEGRTGAGDVQIMSAGSGVTHSEFNLEEGKTTLFQIWLVPDRNGVKPSWGAKAFPKAQREAGFAVLASGRKADAGGDALSLNADGAVLATTLKAGQSVTLSLGQDRGAYLVPAVGSVTVNGVTAHERDGVAVAEEEAITVTALEDAEVVLVEMAAN